MSIEDQLRDSLRRRAASVRPRPDLDDVGARTASRERRTRRFLTAGLVVALIAGPLAGFAVARAGDDGGSDVATGGGGGGRALASGAADAATSALALPTDQPLEKLFFRTTADGVVIRAYKTPGASTQEPAQPCPAAPGHDCITLCATAPMITGELSTDEAVTVAYAGAGQASDDDTFVATAEWSTFGVAEGAPTRWVIASVSPSVARVRASFAGGATDEMEPVGGIVILAGRVTDADGGSGTLEAIADDGSVLHQIDIVPGTGAVANSASATESSSELRTEASASGSGSSANASSSVSSSASGTSGWTGCVAPLPVPAQPDPSAGEQPADPAAARAEIEQAFAAVYTSAQGFEEKRAYIEAPDRLARAFATALQGPQAADAGATSATVTDVSFLSPTEAAVLFDIETSNLYGSTGTSGRAVLTGGAWKVSNATLCASLALAGGACQ